MGEKKPLGRRMPSAGTRKVNARGTQAELTLAVSKDLVRAGISSPQYYWWIIYCGLVEKNGGPKNMQRKQCEHAEEGNGRG